MKEITLLDIQNFVKENPANHHSLVLSKINTENLKQGKDYCIRLKHHKSLERYMYFDIQGHDIISNHIIYHDSNNKMYCIILKLNEQGDHTISEYAIIENERIFDEYI